jgi:hypothetical protein
MRIVYTSLHDMPQSYEKFFFVIQRISFPDDIAACYSTSAKVTENNYLLDVIPESPR